MRIAINAFFYGQRATGSGQYTFQLMRHLPGEESHEYFMIELEETGYTGPARCLRAITPFDRRSENLAKLWFEQISFPHLCRKVRADVAHVPYFAPPLLPTVPTVVTIHDLIPLLLPAYRRSLLVRLYNRLVSAAARRAALIITDSKASKMDIVRLLKIQPERVRVIYLAVEDIFRPVRDEARLAEMRGKYGLPPRYILYLGGFDQRKNLSALLQAFAMVEERVHLVIAGRLPARDVPLFPDPRRLVREMNLEEKVIFTGWVVEEDKPALYSGAELFVFPSLYEGFGLPVLEALACGTPAVVSEAGSLPEIVGKGGVTCPPTDVEGLAGAIAALLEDKERRACFQAEALAQAARFSWRDTARQTLAAYQDAQRARR
ncbi:MAG: glycosyltransferase family 4 protein [Anaerolineae bacterium]